MTTVAELTRRSEPATLAESYKRVARVMAERENSPIEEHHGIEWPPPLAALQETSYCTACDALPGECEHRGHRYLLDAAYTCVEGDSPRSWRWGLSEAQQWRLSNPVSTWPQMQRDPSGDVLSLEAVLKTVGRRAFVDERLHDQIVDLYEADPELATSLVTAFEDGAASGRFKNPGGFLASRLRDLAARASK